MTDANLSDIFKKKLPKVHWQKIETWSTGQGVPDLNGCVDGVEFWIENKRTSANALAHSFSPEQIAWAERRLRAGGRVFIAVRCQNRARGADELHLFHGSAGRALNAGGLRAAQALSAWANGPANWNWLEIVRKLTIS